MNASPSLHTHYIKKTEVCIYNVHPAGVKQACKQRHLMNWKGTMLQLKRRNSC